MDITTYSPNYADRPALAHDYHMAGYSCVQAVLGAFADQFDIPFASLMAAGGSFGGGGAGTHEELCGAATGALIAIGLLYPFSDCKDQDKKQYCYQIAREFRSRFQMIFGHTVCKELLNARPGLSEHTPAAARLGLTRHCDIMIVTAVEIVEEILREFER